MTSKSLVYKTLDFDSPERIPRQMWLLPWAESKYPNEAFRIRKEFPDDIIQCPALYEKPPIVQGGKFKIGTYIDEWNCHFSNPEDGVMGIVHHPLISDWSDLKKLKPPEEMLNPDKESIRKFCAASDQFVYAGNIIRPFERFQFIRTMEQSFMDVMLEEAGYTELLDILHQHFCKEVEAWCQTDVDAIFLMDDWGTQDDMMVPPFVFHKHFKAMYREYCEIAKHHNKKVFMHSDGNILEIFEDIIEVGVDAINSQIFCMNMDKLSDKFAGRITFWGEIDRQRILPEGSLKEVEKAVFQIYEKLYRNGGVIAQCEFGLGAKPENVRQVFETWNRV